MDEQERTEFSTSLGVERLFEGDETLYYEKPSHIASLVEKKLNKLREQSLSIEDIVIIPDYHNINDDGGVKDILFLTEPRELGSQPSPHWKTKLVIPDDGRTMHGWKTPKIKSLLQEAISETEKEGGSVGHVIPIIDSHKTANLQSIGGYDGLKNFIICYQKR